MTLNVLRRVQDHRRVAPNICVYGISTVFTLSTTFVLSGRLQPTLFGLYALLLSITIIASATMSRSVTIPVLRAVARAGGVDRSSLFAIWRFVMVRAAFTGFVTAGIFAAISMIGVFPIFSTRLILVAAMSASLIVAANGNSCIAWGAGATLVPHLPDQIARPVVQLISVLVLFAWHGPSIEVAVIALLLSAAASFALSLYILYLYRDRAFKPTSEVKLVSHTRSLTLSTLLTSLNTQIELLTLGWFAPLASAGIFRLATAIANYVNTSATITAQVFSPKIGAVRERREELRQVIAHSRRLAVALAAIAFVLIVLTSGVALVPLLGERYAAAFWPIVILSAANLIGSGAATSSNVLQMMERSPTVTKVQAISLAVRVALAVVLIPPFGLWGAAATAVLGSLIYRHQIWRALNRELDAMGENVQHC